MIVSSFKTVSFLSRDIDMGFLCAGPDSISGGEGDIPLLPMHLDVSPLNPLHRSVHNAPVL